MQDKPGWVSDTTSFIEVIGGLISNTSVGVEVIEVVGGF